MPLHYFILYSGLSALGHRSEIFQTKKRVVNMRIEVSEVSSGSICVPKCAWKAVCSALRHMAMHVARI